MVVENFEAKLETFRRHGIDVCCGGSLFELAVHRKKLNEYIAFLQDHDFKHVEVSDGTIHISLAEKLRYIERMAKHFTVFSEVGRKDRTHVVAPRRWVDQIKSEIGAGSWKVIVEGRESGTVGIYHSSGEIKAGLIDEIQMQIDTGPHHLRGAPQAAAGLVRQALRSQREPRQHPARGRHLGRDHPSGAARRHLALRS